MSPLLTGGPAPRRRYTPVLAFRSVILDFRGFRDANGAVVSVTVPGEDAPFALAAAPLAGAAGLGALLGAAPGAPPPPLLVRGRLAADKLAAFLCELPLSNHRTAAFGLLCPPPGAGAAEAAAAGWAGRGRVGVAAPVRDVDAGLAR